MPTLYETMIKIGVDTSEIDSGMKKAEGAVGGFGSTIKGVFGGNLLYGAVTKVGGAIMNFTKGSIQAGMSFDSAMSQVQATMLKTSEEMENDIGSVETAYGHFEGNLRQFAQFLGENTAFSATQAAEALNYMALAGYNTQQSMDMLPNVLSLAAAGGMDLARASDMITDSQTAFGISAERTTQMVDEMAKAAASSNTNVTQLGEAFLTVGGLARELNGGFVTLADGTQAEVDGLQELEIALGSMANAGIKGSEAGTHMRNMLMKLTGPTSEGAELFEQMGVSAFDAQGKMRSLSDIFGDLSTQFGNMTQQDKLQAIQKLFNARDLASAEALLGSIEGEYVKIGDDVYSVGTAYEKWGDAIYDSNQGFEYVRSTWDSLGESILNAEGAGTAMANIQLDNLTGATTLFKSALEGAQIAISDKLMPYLTKTVGLGTKLLQTFTTAFKGGGMQNVFDVGVNLVKRLTYGISKTLPDMIPVAMEMLEKFSGSLRQNVGKLVDVGLSLITVIARSLIQNLPVFIETVPTIISNIAGIINDNLPKLVETGWNIIKMLAQGIIDAMPTIIEQFPKIIQAIFDVWKAVNWVELGWTVIRLIVRGITALISNIPDLLRTIGNTALEWFRSIDWSGLGSQVINFIVNGIQALFTDIPTKLKSIGDDAWEKFKSIDWAGVGSKVINFIVSGLTSIGSNVATKLKSIGEDAWNKFKEISWSGLGSAIIDGIIAGIGSGWGLIQKLRDLAGSALQAAKDRLNIESPSKAFRDEVGKMIPAGIAVGIDQNAGLVDDALADIADTSMFNFDDFDWEAIIDDDGRGGNHGEDKPQVVETPDLLNRVNYLIGILEYYLPKNTFPTEGQITDVVSQRINRQVKELGAVW